MGMDLPKDCEIVQTDRKIFNEMKGSVILY
jgi:hypothetical protein